MPINPVINLFKDALAFTMLNHLTRSHDSRARLYIAAALLFGLSACSTTHKVIDTADAGAENNATVETTSAASAESDKTVETQTTVEQAATEEVVETRPLTSPFVYRYLLGEISGQRGDFEQSSHIFYQLAQSEQDPRFAERAAKIAAFGQVGNLIYPSVRLWAELAPNSREAQQAITEILIKANKVEDAEPHLSNLLKDESSRPAGFIMMGKLLHQSPEKEKILQLVQNLAQPYPALPEAQIAIAQSAINANQTALAIKHLDQALELRPGWNLAALMKGELLFKQSVPDAIDFHEGFLALYPKLNDVRLNYVKGLVQHDDYARAKSAFPTVIAEAKATLDRTDALETDNRKAKRNAQKAAEKNMADTLAMVGLLAYQGEDYNTANSYFQEALDFNFHDPDQIYLYFGEVAEKLNRPSIAKNWYQRIESGKHYVSAQLNIAGLIKESESVDAAIDYLNGVDHLTVEQQIVVIQTQASMLHEKQRHQDAFLLLQKAVKEKPQSVSLQYDYALSAERVKQFDIMETQLNAVIEARPNFAPAYNALGYSYADRNVKLEEALTLIQKALIIAPNDHYMLDSLGWVYYRLGKLDKAVENLQKAFEIQADPEIAAHLGEVLWQQGKHDEANRIWQESLDKYPGNQTLRTTVNKFNA